MSPGATAEAPYLVWTALVCSSLLALVVGLFLYTRLVPSHRWRGGKGRRRSSSGWQLQQQQQLLLPVISHRQPRFCSPPVKKHESDIVRDLVEAADSGDCQLVEKLLRRHPDLNPNERDQREGKMKCPILVAAVGKGHIDVARLLIGQSAIDCNLCRSDKTSPIVMAASRGHSEIAKLLLAWPRIDVNSRNSNESTALIVSARAGNAPIVKMLVDFGAERSLCQYTKLTALHFASREGHLEIVDFLLDGYSAAVELIRAQDQHGFTALMYCCQRDCHVVAKRLVDRLKAGGDQERNNRGGTALHVAAFHNSHKSLSVLLESGQFGLSVRDARGHTALDVARQRNSSDCEKILLRHCGRIGADASCVSQKAKSTRAETPRNLHQHMLNCGFSRPRAILQAAIADTQAEIGNIAELRQRYDDRHASGSYADGWGCNLGRMNGSLAADSDVDMSVRKKGLVHVTGSCSCSDAEKTYNVEKGFLQIDEVSGDRPSKTDLGVGIRPSMDFAGITLCCATPLEILERLQKLPKSIRDALPKNPQVEAVRSVRPNVKNASEMRISCTTLEKGILRQMSTCQGQVFVLIKYIFKRIVKASGLKSYHSKTLMFFLLCEIPEQDWQPDRLEELVARALIRFEQLVRENDIDSTVCMRHFFFDAWVYFKSGVAADKDEILRSIADIRDNLSFVLSTYQDEQLRPLPMGQASPFVFHPFTKIEMVTPFKRPPVGESGKLKLYRQAYQMTFKILEDIGNPESQSSRESLLRDIDSLPDYARTTREVLRVLLLLKCKDDSAAREVLLAAASIEAKRCLDFKPCDSVEEATVYVKSQLESTNSAWKFCFYFNKKLQFGFSPFSDDQRQQLGVPAIANCGLYRLPGDLLLDFAYFVNFDAILKSLCLCLTPESCPQLLAKWFDELTSVEDGDDIYELFLFAKFANSPEQLEHCRERMQQLTIHLDEELDMIAFVKEKIGGKILK